MCNNGALLSTPATARRGRHGHRVRGGISSSGCRARAATQTIRCAAAPDGNSTTLHHNVRELLPPPGPTSAQLIATVAAKAATPAPPPKPTNAAVEFCRTSWPLFVLAQTGALIGAAYSGVDSRRKREEIGKLNDKLRKMMEKMGDSSCSFDWSVDEDEEADWPGSKVGGRLYKINAVVTHSLTPPAWFQTLSREEEEEEE
jgi:hypothetical protein